MKVPMGAYLNAHEARDLTQQTLKAYDRQRDLEVKAHRMEEERLERETWALNGADLIIQIMGYIRKAAKLGDFVTREPSDINPYGDTVIWLKGENRRIKGRLMTYFRNQGYRVTDFSDYGLRIEWRS